MTLMANLLDLDGTPVESEPAHEAATDGALGALIAHAMSTGDFT